MAAQYFPIGVGREDQSLGINGEVPTVKRKSAGLAASRTDGRSLPPVLPTMRDVARVGRRTVWHPVLAHLNVDTRQARSASPDTLRLSRTGQEHCGNRGEIKKRSDVVP